MLNTNYNLPPPTAGGHNGISGGLQKGSIIRCTSQYGHLNNTVPFWEIMRTHEELHYSKSLPTEELSGMNRDTENLTTQQSDINVQTLEVQESWAVFQNTQKGDVAFRDTGAPRHIGSLPGLVRRHPTMWPFALTLDKHRKPDTIQPCCFQRQCCLQRLSSTTEMKRWWRMQQT